MNEAPGQRRLPHAPTLVDEILALGEELKGSTIEPQPEGTRLILSPTAALSIHPASASENPPS